MDSGSHKLREMETVLLSDTIIVISSSFEKFVVGCLDDSITLWDNTFSPFSSEPSRTWRGGVTGLLDIKFSPNGKKLATTELNSVIKIWDIETQQVTSFEVPVMSAWKIAFAQQHLFTCGQLGHIQMYNYEKKELVKKLEAGQIFFTSIAVSNNKGLLAAGNNNGDLHIVNLEKKYKIAAFKPHSKLIRSLSFSEDCSKLLSGSDDATLKIFDIVSQKVISNYDGHKQAVSCVRTHPTDNKIAFSCSFDKSIKIWDLRMKSCVDSFQSGSAMWTLEAIGRHLVAGGQNGALSIFSIQ